MQKWALTAIWCEFLIWVVVVINSCPEWSFSLIGALYGICTNVQPCRNKQLILLLIKVFWSFLVWSCWWSIINDRGLLLLRWATEVIKRQVIVALHHVCPVSLPFHCQSSWLLKPASHNEMVRKKTNWIGKLYQTFWLIDRMTHEHAVLLFHVLFLLMVDRVKSFEVIENWIALIKRLIV